MNNHLALNVSMQAGAVTGAGLDLVAALAAAGVDDEATLDLVRNFYEAEERILRAVTDVLREAVEADKSGPDCGLSLGGAMRASLLSSCEESLEAADDLTVDSMMETYKEAAAESKADL